MPGQVTSAVIHPPSVATTSVWAVNIAYQQVALIKFTSSVATSEWKAQQVQKLSSVLIQHSYNYSPEKKKDGRGMILQSSTKYARVNT